LIEFKLVKVEKHKPEAVNYSVLETKWQRCQQKNLAEMPTKKLGRDANIENGRDANKKTWQRCQHRKWQRCQQKNLAEMPT